MTYLTKPFSPQELSLRVSACSAGWARRVSAG